MGNFNVIVKRKQRLARMVPDWRYMFRGDGRPSDIALTNVLKQRLEGERGKPVVLIGRQSLAGYLSGRLGSGVSIVADDYRVGLIAAYREKIRALRIQATSTAFLICEIDRVNAAELRQLLGPANIIDFDAVAEAAPNLLPDDAWCETYEHIYPIDVPEIRFQTGLDALILDVPARSLAQLPIGFAYVYRALKQTSLRIQAVDIDVIAYHRYHSRRCLNQWKEIRDGDHVHSEDPWQATSYLFWTSPKTVSYFEDLVAEVSAKIVAARPKVLGFSLHQTSHCFIKAVVDRVMPQLSDTVLVVGGMSCYQSVVSRQVFPQADYVVVGEADVVVGPLFEALARGEQPKDIPGIVSRHDTSGRMFIGAPLPHNLDMLGAPDYSFTSLDLYRNWNNYRLMPVVGSRGCGWSRCTFCAERFNWRARTPERVAEEIEYYTRHGFRDFVFNESDFNSNHEFVRRLCRGIIRRRLDVNMSAQLRISKLSDFAYFSLMKQAGFNCLRFGVDGLSENTLRLQRKGYRLEDVRNNLRDCHRLGIYTEINVVLGVPGETEADIEESSDFIIEMKPYIGRVAFINPLMMFVGSVYYNEPEEFGIKFRIPLEKIKEYVVSLPDDSWYSENPYIDEKVRHARFFRVVERLSEAGVPLGDFAKFTAEFRKRMQGDSHTVASKELTMLPDLSDLQGIGGEGGSAGAVGDGPAGMAAPVPETPPAIVQSLASLAPASRRIVRHAGSFYLTLSAGDETLAIAPYSDQPVLLGSHEGYNLVCFRDQIIGAPQALGPIDLRRDDVRRNQRLIIGDSEDEVIARINAWLAAAEPSAPPRSPKLIGSYRNHNIVRYRGLYYAVPLALGPLNLANDEERRREGILIGETETMARRMIDSFGVGMLPTQRQLHAV